MAERVFPAYFRSWERYPLGRQYERVTRLEKDGHQVSVTKVTDANGSAEYSLTTKVESDSGDSFVKFVTPTFSCGPSTPSNFDALHAELVALCASSRK